MKSGEVVDVGGVEFRFSSAGGGLGLDRERRRMLGMRMRMRMRVGWWRGAVGGVGHEDDVDVVDDDVVGSIVGTTNNYC